MKFRVPEILLGALLTVAVFAMGMMFSSMIVPSNRTTVQTADFRESKQKPQEIVGTENADDRIAKYTLWLAILTGGLVLVSSFQGFFLIRADKTARIASDAAAQSARAQISIEGARLIFKPHHHNYWEAVGQYANRWPSSPQMGPIRNTVFVIFTFKNYGKTPATMKEVNIVLKRTSEMPDGIFITSPILDLPSEIVISSGLQSDEFRAEISQYFTMAEAIDVENGKGDLWIYGCVVYDDFFGREGTQRFLYKLKIRGGFSRIYDQTEFRTI